MILTRFLTVIFGLVLGLSLASACDQQTKADRHLKAGDILLCTRPSNEAIAEYDEAIRLEPQLPVAYYKRGWTYEHIGRCHSAIQDYTEAIRLDPNDFVTYNSRGRTYFHMDQPYRAIQDFDDSIRLHPAAAIYVNRGDVYLEVGQWELGIRDYDAAIGLDPSHPRAYAGRAMVPALLGEDSEAQRYLKLSAARGSVVGLRFDEEVQRLLAVSLLSVEAKASGSDLSIGRQWRFCIGPG